MSKFYMKDTEGAVRTGMLMFIIGLSMAALGVGLAFTMEAFELKFKALAYLSMGLAYPGIFIGVFGVLVIMGLVAPYNFSLFILIITQSIRGTINLFKQSNSDT